MPIPINFSNELSGKDKENLVSHDKKSFNKTVEETTQDDKSHWIEVVQRTKDDETLKNIDEIDNELFSSKKSKKPKFNIEGPANEQSSNNSKINQTVFVNNLSNRNKLESHNKILNDNVYDHEVTTNDLSNIYCSKDCNEIESGNLNLSNDNNDDQMINLDLSWQVGDANEKLVNGDIIEFDKVVDDLSHEMNEYSSFIETADSIETVDTKNFSMLFEDFLDIYTEVILPKHWFAFMISKNHRITVTYACMNVSTSGVPHIEKEVFLNSEMLIRCCIMNKEINPHACNLIEEGKSLNVKHLSDLENLILKFDKANLCTGK